MRLAHIKRKILALRSMYLMRPQADIDEIELETMIQMLYLLFQWLALPTDELWITYGSEKNVQNIPALAIVMSSGPDKASTLQCSMHQLGVILLLLLEGVERKRLGICGTCFLN